MNTSHLTIAEALTKLLDEEFSIFGFKFGLDPIIGLFPVLGDILPLGLSVYILWIAKQMKVPQDKLNEMLRNILIDFVLGLIPVVGDASDFIFKANSKNLKILKTYAPSEVLNAEIV